MRWKVGWMIVLLIAVGMAGAAPKKGVPPTKSPLVGPSAIVAPSHHPNYKGQHPTINSVTTVFPFDIAYATGSAMAHTAGTDTSFVDTCNIICQYYIYGFDTFNYLGWAKFDVSDIPDGDYIWGVYLNVYVYRNSQPSWAVTKESLDPLSSTAGDLYNEIMSNYLNSSVYSWNYESGDLPSGYYRYRLNYLVASDLEAALTQDWFALGFVDFDFDPRHLINMEGWCGSHPPYLEVLHASVPPPNCFECSFSDSCGPFPTDFWLADMAYNDSTGEFYQVEVDSFGSDILIWDPSTCTYGEAYDDFTGISQRGIAYEYDTLDDTGYIYVGGWNSGKIYKFYAPSPGDSLSNLIIDSCDLSGTDFWGISGLAWDDVDGGLYMVNSAGNQLVKIDFNTCTVVDTYDITWLCMDQYLPDVDAVGLVYSNTDHGLWAPVFDAVGGQASAINFFNRPEDDPGSEGTADRGYSLSPGILAWGVGYDEANSSLWISDYNNPFKNFKMSCPQYTYELDYDFLQNRIAMFSIPIEAPDMTVAGVIEDDIGSNPIADQWTIAWWDGSRYLRYKRDPGFPDTLQLGRGYWFTSMSDLSFSVTGTPVHSYYYSIPLFKGFTMVGDPFLDEVWWEDVMVTCGSSDTITVGAAADSGWISPSFWYWDPEAKQYIEYSYPDGAFVPTEGYWVRTYVDSCTLLIPLKGGLLAKRGAPPKALDEDRDLLWKVELAAASEGASDLKNVIGVSKHAKPGYDLFDREDVKASVGFPDISSLRGNGLGEFPAVPHLDLYFPHSDWSKYAGYYKKDIRSPKDENNVWVCDVVAEGLKGKEVTLSWTGLPDNGLNYELVDLESGRSVSMRSSNSYVYYADEDKDLHEFQIMGTQSRETRLPQSFSLGYAEPNPFGDRTLIRYALPRDVGVELKIYDVSGRAVRTLVKGKEKAGFKQAMWDGRDNLGRKVSSGVYFYRLKAGDYQATKKMLLQR